MAQSTSEKNGRDSRLSRPTREGAGLDGAHEGSSDHYLALQQEVQSQLGNAWMHRVQLHGPESHWDLQILHLLQVARETEMDLSRYLPWRADATWNQALEPFYRVVFHELHEGASLDAGLEVDAPEIGAMDILGADLSAELGLPMGGVAGMVAETAVAAEAPVLAARAAAGGETNLGDRMGRLLNEAGSGRSLSEPEQRFLQRVHGQRFSEIRLHEGPVAQEAARTIAARAFTIGRDIYMGEPVKADSAAGAELLAHEATHVKQAAEGRLPGPTGDGLQVSSPEASYEREAEAVGQAGSALRQILDRHEQGARPAQGDLSWFNNRFGSLLSPDALTDIFDDKAAPGGADVESLARQGLADLLVDEACAAWLSTNSAMGAMAAGTDPARASALGLLQQALSATFASAIAGAQAGVPGALGRLVGLVGPLSPDALRGLPVDPRVGRAELVSAARDLLSQTTPVLVQVSVMGSAVEPSALLQGGILDAVETLVGAGGGTPGSNLVDVSWQDLETAADDTAGAPLSPASADWGLLDRMAIVDPAGRAVLSSLQAMLPAGASASDEMVETALRASLGSQVHASASGLQISMLERLEQGPAPAGVDPSHIAGLVGLLGALDEAGRAESTSLPSLVGIAGRPGAAALPEIGLQHAPYPDFADRASFALDQTPDFAMSVGFGDISVDAPALLGATAEGAISDLGNVGAEGTLFRKADGPEAPDLDDPAVDQALSRKGSGRPLPQHLRAQLEARMGVDLSDVRVHVDTFADAAARAVQARAFTTGQDIFFRDGAFDAAGAEGQELIAHEVVHTVQAGPSAASGAGRVSEPGELAEVEADRIATEALSGDLASDQGVEAPAAAAPVEAVAQGDALMRKPEDELDKFRDRTKDRRAPVPSGEEEPTQTSDIDEAKQKDKSKEELTEDEIQAEIDKAEALGTQDAVQPDEDQEVAADQDAEQEEADKDKDKEGEEEEEEGAEQEAPAEDAAAETADAGAEAPAAGPETGTGTGGPASGPAMSAAASAGGGGGADPTQTFDQLLGGALSGYAAEKSWHDSWVGGGSQVGMSGGENASLVGEALAAGGLTGLGTAASNILVDTILNKATKSIPYASGFIGMFDMVKAGGPAAWIEGEAGKIGDSLGSGVDKIANANDWIDYLDGGIDMLDGVNQAVGLASTICMVVAAAGFLASFIFPALLPFVCLAAKWGLVLGEINTLVGIGVTAMRGISVVSRSIQMLQSDADPETQVARAAKLREQTAKFTGEWATRQGKNLRTKAQGMGDQKRAAKKGDPIPGGKGGDSAAKSANDQRTSRRSRITEGLNTLGKIATGGDTKGQMKKTGAEFNHAKAMTSTVAGADRKGEGGLQMMGQLSNLDAEHKEKGASATTFLSEGSQERLGSHYKKQAAADNKQRAHAEHANAESGVATAQQHYEGKQTQLELANSKLEGAGQKPQGVAGPEHADALQQKYQGEKSALDGLASYHASQKAELDAYRSSIHANGPPSAEQLRTLQQKTVAIEDSQGILNQWKGEVETHRLNAEHARATLDLHDAHGALTAAKDQHATTKGQLDGAHDEHLDASKKASVLTHTTSGLKGAAKGTKEALGSFKPGQLSAGMDGKGTPGNAYGHRGKGVKDGKELLGEAADLASGALFMDEITNTVNDATSSMLNFADATADPKKDPGAAAARAAFIAESHQSMDEGFRSVTGELAGPPVEQEAAIDENAGRYNQLVDEIDGLSTQLGTVEELKQQNEQEKQALQTGQAMMGQTLQLTESEEQVNEQKKAQQEQIKEQATQQETQGTETSDAQAQQMGGVMDFVSGFASLMSIIPSRLLGGGGGNDAGSQISEGVGSMGDRSTRAVDEASTNRADAEEMTAQTEAANAELDQAASESQAVQSEMVTEQSNAESADADIESARSAAESRKAEAEQERAAAQAAHAAAVAALNGWSASHNAARTGQEASLDGNLDSIEKRLAEQRAAAGK